MTIIDTSQSIFDFKVTGQVNLKLYNQHGELIDERDTKNLVVTTGKNYIASRIASNTADIVSYMGIGTSNFINGQTIGSTTPVVGDTTLTAPITPGNRVTATPVASGTQVTYTGTFGPSNGSGGIVEAGLFSALTGGTMLARTTFGIITKAISTDTLTLTWTLTVS